EQRVLHQPAGHDELLDRDPRVAE
ncbi:MAG: hypothetical protein AVDCRST_MAG67-2694, partial [uncultured Solirubrobacteraceae bacterium]